MRALFEICLRRGWCEMSSFMLQYCKAVDRQIWPHQHPLRQFDRELSADVCFGSLLLDFFSFGFSNSCVLYLQHVFFQILRKLEERGADLDRLYEMEEKDIGLLIRYAPGGKVDILFSLQVHCIYYVIDLALH